MANLVIVECCKIDGDKGEPNDARAVHCETNVLGFVKVLGDFTRFELTISKMEQKLKTKSHQFLIMSATYSIKCAQDDEQHVVEERKDEAEITHAARQDGGERLRMNFPRSRPFKN